MVLVVVLIVVLVLVVVVQEVLLLVLMVVVELVVGRLPSPLSDILAEERARGLVVGMLMLVGLGGVRMELVIVVMLVAVVVVFMAVLVMGLHITGVEFMLVLELLVPLVLQLARFALIAFFILIIALLSAKASLFSSSILAITSLW